jgi:hypothetical protein
MIENPDYLWTTTNLGIWSTLEIGIALTASSLATLKPLMKRIRLFGNFSDLSGSGSADPALSRDVEASRQDSARAGTYGHGSNQAIFSGGVGGEQQWRDRWEQKDSIEVELTTITGRTYNPHQSQDTNVK